MQLERRSVLLSGARVFLNFFSIILSGVISPTWQGDKQWCMTCRFILLTKKSLPTIWRSSTQGGCERSPWQSTRKCTMKDVLLYIYLCLPVNSFFTCVLVWEASGSWGTFEKNVNEDEVFHVYLTLEGWGFCLTQHSSVCHVIQTGFEPADLQSPVRI